MLPWPRRLTVPAWKRTLDLAEPKPTLEAGVQILTSTSFNEFDFSLARRRRKILIARFFTRGTLLSSESSVPLQYKA